MYGGTRVTAVDHLCLGIPRGECFGLLGINGKMRLHFCTYLLLEMNLKRRLLRISGPAIKSESSFIIRGGKDNNVQHVDRRFEHY